MIGPGSDKNPQGGEYRGVPTTESDREAFSDGEEEVDILLWEVITTLVLVRVRSWQIVIFLDVENRHGSPSKLILGDLRTRRIRREGNRTKERRHSRLFSKVK